MVNPQRSSVRTGCEKGYARSLSASARRTDWLRLWIRLRHVGGRAPSGEPDRTGRRWSIRIFIPEPSRRADVHSLTQRTERGKVGVMLQIEAAPRTCSSEYQ